jgi:sterol desaturase/sphingolipid hydroxylase (fatty acid hydroxylase superfamily)
MLILLLALGLLLLVAIAEGVIWSWTRGDYDWRAFGVSMADLFGTIVKRLVVPIGVASPLFHLAHEYRLFTMDLGAAWQFLLLFLGQDFCYYWFHRASHRVRWFWATHAVHHSPEQLTFAAAFRLGLTARLTGSTLFYVPLSYLGFAPEVVLLAVTVNLLYQFWIHSERIPRLGPLELVLNTPSHHRVHHARNLDYLDANYGGVLIVFDRMFGTFVREKPELRCDFGLVHPIRSYNPIVVEMHGWMSLLRDLRTARSLPAVLGYLFGPPGWSADGPGTTTHELRSRQSATGKPAQPPAEIACPVAHECGDDATTALPLAAASGR